MAEERYRGELADPRLKFVSAGDVKNGGDVPGVPTSFTCLATGTVWETRYGGGTEVMCDCCRTAWLVDPATREILGPKPASA